jgi:hypothetical protein
VSSTLGFALLLLGNPLAGQSPFPAGPSTGGRLGQQFPDSSGPYEQNSPEQRRLQAINAQRQKALVSDTEKLLKLAKELNDEVASVDSSGMSDDQLRKVTEIAKLAKSVKEKMSYSAGGYPGLPTPLTTAPPIQ